MGGPHDVVYREAAKVRGAGAPKKSVRARHSSRPFGVIPVQQITSWRLLVTHTNVDGPHPLPVIWRFIRCRSLQKGASMMGMRGRSSLAVLPTPCGGLLGAGAAAAPTHRS